MSKDLAKRPNNPGDSDERSRDRDRKRRQRAAACDIQIPPCQNPERRATCEADVFVWLSTYYPQKFDGPWTPSRREIVESVMRATGQGGDQAVAAPRGDGKTSIIEGAITYCIVRGLLKFPVLVGATGTDAGQLLDNLKLEYEGNELLLADYPEVFAPIWALGGANQRARTQTVNGKPTNIRWTGDKLVFPCVDGSLASGAVIVCRSIDGHLRGIRHGNQRPDFVFIDDPDDEGSAASVTETDKKERAIEKSIGGMAGAGRSISRVMACTIINATCLAARYTDPKQKPSWRGKRFKLLSKFPKRMDLWEQYMDLRSKGLDIDDDTPAMAAHDFYLANYDEMNRGAEISNPGRHRQKAFPPEIDTLQFCFNEIADKGREMFDSEYQNEPSDQSRPEDVVLDPYTIGFKRGSGYPRHEVPVAATKLIGFIDLGKRGLPWAVGAFGTGFVGHVIDYGVQDVHNWKTIGEGAAIRRALHDWREDRFANPYVDENGELRKLDLVLIDNGNGEWEDEVWAFTREVGRPFRCSKGFGSGHGRSPFRNVKTMNESTVPGDHYFLSRQAKNGQWLACFDADYWWQFQHQRWATEPRDDTGRFRRGSLSLFEAERPGQHKAFAHQVMAQEYREKMTRKGVVTELVVHSRQNHWGDCCTGLCVGARMLGIKLAEARVVRRQLLKPTSDRQRKNQRRGKPKGGFAGSWRGRY